MIDRDWQGYEGKWERNEGIRAAMRGTTNSKDPEGKVRRFAHVCASIMPLPGGGNAATTDAASTAQKPSRRVRYVEHDPLDPRTVLLARRRVPGPGATGNHHGDSEPSFALEPGVIVVEAGAEPDPDPATGTGTGTGSDTVDCLPVPSGHPDSDGGPDRADAVTAGAASDPGSAPLGGPGSHGAPASACATGAVWSHPSHSGCEDSDGMPVGPGLRGLSLRLDSDTVVDLNVLMDELGGPWGDGDSDVLNLQLDSDASLLLLPTPEAGRASAREAPLAWGMSVPQATVTVKRPLESAFDAAVVVEHAVVAGAGELFVRSTQAASRQCAATLAAHVPAGWVNGASPFPPPHRMVNPQGPVTAAWAQATDGPGPGQLGRSPLAPQPFTGAVSRRTTSCRPCQVLARHCRLLCQQRTFTWQRSRVPVRRPLHVVTLRVFNQLAVTAAVAVAVAASAVQVVVSPIVLGPSGCC